ncbi:MAG: tripartite tricarboxylate transporter TctB family protein [Deltaproteobacteria bacterium]|nr:tripartite tricarboxylate transporter TctB family protein [Deltaproteobacteria bacterium]
MKNPSEVVTGVVVLGLCAIGAVGTASLPSPIRAETVGPASLPAASLAVVSFCALLLIVFGLRNEPVGSVRGNRKAIAKSLVFFVLYGIYLVILCHLGPMLYYIDGFPFQHSFGFAVTNAVFLYVAFLCLGRKDKRELLLISIGFTALLVLVFSLFFKVLLP